MTDDLATQDVLDQNDGTGDGSENGSNDEPFLQVNERTVYATPDDAIKGFKEAQTQITSLSELRDVFKDYGVKDLKSVNGQFLRGLLNELLDHREKVKAAGANKQGTPANADAGDGKVDPKTAAAIKWLKDNAKAAGYLTQDEAKALKDQIDALKQGRTQETDEAFQSRVDESQGEFNRLLTVGKYQPTDEQKAELEDNIKAWINGSDQRVKDWNRGGKSMLDLIEKGLAREVKAMGLAPSAAASKIVAGAKRKQGLVTNTAKRMPNDGGSDTIQAKKTETSRDRVDKAWEIFQAAQKGDQNDAG